MPSSNRPCKEENCQSKSLYSWLPYCMSHWQSRVESNCQAFIDAERIKKSDSVGK